MSNYPDGMSSDYFDEVTGGGKYEADWQYRDTVDAETVSDDIENIQKLIANARDVIAKDKAFYASELGKQVYNLLRAANSGCDDVMQLCVYDANPNNGE